MELQVKQLKDQIISDFSSLPPDIKEAKERVFELDNLVKMMHQSVTEENPVEVEGQ